MAPEVLQRAAYTPLVDSWSVGMIIFYLYVGCRGCWTSLIRYQVYQGAYGAQRLSKLFLRSIPHFEEGQLVHSSLHATHTRFIQLALPQAERTR